MTSVSFSSVDLDLNRMKTLGSRFTFFWLNIYEPAT